MFNRMFNVEVVLELLLPMCVLSYLDMNRIFTQVSEGCMKTQTFEIVFI